MKILDENGEIFAWRLTEKNIHEIKAYLDAEDDELSNVYIYLEPDKLYGLGIGILLTDYDDDDYDDISPELRDIAPYSVEPTNILPIGGWLVASDIWSCPDDKTFFEYWDIDEFELVIEDDDDIELALGFCDLLVDDEGHKAIENDKNITYAIERYKNEN